MRAKHWCFTLNNYTDEDIATCKRVGEAHTTTYLVYGLERGESGTPHLQGFVSFESRLRLTQIRELISTRGHFEIARGSPRQAAQYCKKDGDYHEFGTPPDGQGTRNDIQEVQKRIIDGATKNEIRDEFFAVYAKYPKAIDSYISDLEPKRTWETEVIVYWGKTGKGKTRAVFEFINLEDIYVHPGDSWFDGYNGQPVALFDDFNGSEFKLSYLLKLLDRYPMKVPIKGSFVNWRPKHIFITSNKDPNTWYENAHEEQRNALFRRINKIREFK